MVIAPFIIPTRQKAEVLTETHLPLDGAESFVGDVDLVQGFAFLAILALSDQPFEITIEEATTADGPFVLTQTYTSAVDGAGQERVRERFFPCGTYALITLTNLGGDQVVNDFQVLGYPA